jgi:hypothetical protein
MQDYALRSAQGSMLRQSFSSWSEILRNLVSKRKWFSAIQFLNEVSDTQRSSSELSWYVSKQKTLAEQSCLLTRRMVDHAEVEMPPFDALTPFCRFNITGRIFLICINSFTISDNCVALSGRTNTPIAVRRSLMIDKSRLGRRKYWRSNIFPCGVRAR